MNGRWREVVQGFVRRYVLDRETLPVSVMGLANIAILFSIAVNQILLGLGLAILLFGPRIGGRGKPRQASIEAPFPALILGLYLVWTLVSLALSPLPASMWTWPIGLSQIRKCFIFLTLPAAYTAFRRSRDASWVLKWTLIAASAAGLLAVAEFGIFYRALSTARDFYTAYSKARITGFMGHWQTFSGEQMMVLAMTLALLLYSRKRPWWAWACGAIIGLSLLLSLTRGAWLGFLAAALYLLWPFGRRWVMALPLALLLFFLLAPPLVRDRIKSFADVRRDTSNQARVLMLRTGRNMIAAHPLVGVGPNAVEYSFGSFRPPGPVPEGWYGHLHNTYVQIAAERGLPALALYLWFMLAVFRDQRRLATRLPDDRRYISHGAAACLVAFAVAGCFEYNFGDSEVATLLLFFIAHGYAAAGTEGGETAERIVEDPKGRRTGTRAPGA